MRPKGQHPCLGRLQQESNNDQAICCCLRTGLGVIGAGRAPGTPPTAGRDCHSSPRSMRTGYASHCEWCLHQNSHPTCRQQVRSWSDLLTSRGRREAAFLFSRWMSEFVKVCGCRPHDGGAARTGLAYANLQWRKPREVWRGGASNAMGGLAAVSASTTFAIWHELCEWVKTPFAAPAISES